MVAVAFLISLPADAQLFKNFKRKREARQQQAQPQVQQQAQQQSGHGIFRPQLQAIPTTDLPDSIATANGGNRKCSNGLQVPSERVQSVLVSPQPGLIVTFPIEVAKGAIWGLMKKPKRHDLIESAIQKEALSNATLTHYLDERRIRSVASEVAAHFKDSTWAPKKIEVTKAAYKNFANAMVAHQFSQLELGCTEADLEWLNSVVLAKFEKCLLDSKKAEDLDSCAKQADVHASYNMGYLVTQMKLRETMAEHVSSSTELESYTKASLEHYEKCADKEILSNPRGDKVKSTMLCVGSALVESTRLLANDKVLKTYQEKGMSLAESETHRAQAFDLNEEDCALWRSYREQATPGGRANQVLHQYSDDPKKGTERLTKDVYGCLNAISAKAGPPAVVRELSSNELLSSTIDDLVDGEGADQKRELQRQISRAVIEKAYKPCIERLRKNAGSSLIDVENCRPEIEAIASSELVKESVKQQVEEFSAGLDSGAQAKMQNALQGHEECIEGHYQKNLNSGKSLLASSEVIACTQTTLQEVVAVGAEGRVVSQVKAQVETAASGHNLEVDELIPNLQADLKRLSQECVSKAFHGVSEIEQLSVAASGIEKDCEASMTAHFTAAVAPQVTERVLLSTLSEKLPASVNVDEVVEPFTEEFQDCVDKAREDASGVEARINKCVDRFAQAASGQAAVATLNAALSETLSEGELSQLRGAQNTEILLKQKYAECMRGAKSIQGGSADENQQAIDYMVNCANSAGMIAGLEAAKHFAPRAAGTRELRKGSEDNVLSTLINNSLNVCKRYKGESDSCVDEMSGLQSTVWERTLSGQETSPQEIFLESEFGDKVVKAGIGKALEETLLSVLPPSEARGSAVKMKEGVEAVSQSEYLERAFSTPEGRKIVEGVKAKLMTDPLYKAEKDEGLKGEIQAYLETDLRPGGFVDSVLYSVAGAEYEEQMYNTIQNRKVASYGNRFTQTAAFWGGIVTKKISQESVSYYPWVAQTEGAQKAREYLQENILEYQRENGRLPDEAAMKVHTQRINEFLVEASTQAHKVSQQQQVKTEEEKEKNAKPKPRRRRRN